ncbi:hypothetical protein U3A55_00550 [Salarchaeum sp. III]
MSETPSVGIVGGGVAGLTAATFTARADLEGDRIGCERRGRRSR